MATPTTVEEYLRQVPNPSPCPHSPSPGDPPCADCITRRITTANALRAGQDPSVALGLTQPPVSVTESPVPATAEASGAAVAPSPGPAAVPLVATPTTLQAGETATFETTQTLMEAPDPLVPGMTHTEIQPNANNPLAQLAQAGAPDLALTPEQLSRRQAIEAGTHPAVVELPPVETAHRAPDSVPRSVALGTTQERYEPGAAIAFPEPISGNVLKLYVEEFLELGDVVMVNPATGMLCKYRDPVIESMEALEASETLVLPGVTSDQEPTGAIVGDEPVVLDRPKLHPAGHRDALIKYVKEHWPALAPTKDDVSYIVIELLDEYLGVLTEPSEIVQVFDHRSDPKPTEQAAPMLDAAAAQAVAAAQEATTPPPVPQAAPAAPPPPNDAIAAAAAVAAPQNVPAEQLVTTCEHGMPGTDFSTTPPRSAACASCMMNSEGPPPHMTKLHASRFQQALLETKCARDMCGRDIHIGELIGLVDNVGWCCGVCTKPERVPAA